MNKVTPTALALLLLASTAVEAAAQERQGRGRGERPAASDDGGGRRGGGDGQRGGWRGDGGARRGDDGGQRSQRSEAAPQAQAAQPQQAAPERSAGRAEWRNRQGEGRPNWNRDGGQGRVDRGFRGQRPEAAAPQPAQAVQPNRDWQNRGDRPGMWTRGRPTVEGQRELQRRDGPDRRDWRDDNRRGDDRRDWDNRRGNDNRWDGRDNRRWDNNDRYRERPRYDRRNYPSVWRSSQRFRVSIYRPPVGYYSRNWGYGDILPRGWWGPSYYISDWWQYDLPIPPLGYEWVRVGEDAYLIDTYTGRVVQVAYDIFWW